MGSRERLNVLSRLSAPHVAAGIWKTMMRARHKTRPIPLSRLNAIRRLLGGVDPLYPRFERSPDEAMLSNRELAAVLSKVGFDSWSLGPRSINLVERHISARPPGFVLELGSGVSTVCLAWLMREIHGSERPLVLSVDQEKAFVESTSSLLENLGLERTASVTYAPVVEQKVRGKDTRCYDLSSAIESMDQKADLLLIDGPAGDPGVRFGTLPLALSALKPGATFFLDDAFRDAELDFAGEWSLIPGVEVEGVAPVGTGLLIGKVL